MATINGVTFNMQSLRPVAVHRNSVSEQPGSDTNFITDMGYDGLVLRLEGFEETLATYDSVISEFMKSGEQTLVHRTGWQFEVYSVQLTPELIRGFADNYFPYDLILYTSTPYRESTTLSCRAKAITANNQEWSAEDMLCNNLFDYWSFEDWSAGTSSAPDGWVKGGTGATIAREGAEVKIGTYSAKLTYGSAICYIQPYVTNYLDYSGKTMTVGIWAKTSTASLSRLRVIDGTTTVYSTFHTGGGDWEFLTATINVSSTPSYLAIYARADVAGFVYYDGAVLVEGDSIPDTTFTRDIDTDGSVDAVPDIQVTGGRGDYVALSSEPVSEPGFETVTGWTYTEVDAHGEISGAQSVAQYTEGAKSYYIDYGITVIQSFAAAGGAYGQIARNVDFTTIEFLTFDARVYCAATTLWRLRVYVDSDLIYDYTIPAGTTDWAEVILNVAEYVGTHSLKFQLYSSATNSNDAAIWVDNIISKERPNTNTPQIYNTADTTVKCGVGNIILDEGVHRINADGTGTINYSDDFSDDKYGHDDVAHLNISRDTVNDEMDIADDGYIYWKCDAKGPVTGIPTLTSQINITTGTPTIQISTDASTWYDITTAIVDDVDTVYELDSSSLHLKGNTSFYWRFDCVNAGAATCSIKSFELDVNIVTIDFENPKITSNGANTFRCDQDAASGMNCTVALIYRDRGWPA